MKTIVPDYYPEFHCIAERCRHTCCRGWQIDIDSVSLARYEAIPGTLGTEIRASVEPNPAGSEAPAHFRLTADERCPFLTDEGLCHLILSAGESVLCDICADHPRFRSFWSDRIEIGLGLVCEEAARLILTREAPMRLITLQDDGCSEPLPEDEQELLSLRDTLLAILQDRSRSTDERILHMLSFCELPAEGLAFPSGPLNDTACEQLAVYLLYRTLPDSLYDGRTADRIRFVAEGYCRIRNEWINDPEDIIEPARRFSEQIEYDDETWA